MKTRNITIAALAIALLVSTNAFTSQEHAIKAIWAWLDRCVTHTQEIEQ